LHHGVLLLGKRKKATNATPPAWKRSDLSAYLITAGKRSKHQRQPETVRPQHFSASLAALAEMAGYSLFSRIIAVHDQCFANI
jgi:hypothetical protein